MQTSNHHAVVTNRSTFRLIFASIALAALGVTACIASSLLADEHGSTKIEEGFVSLFDGKQLDGWFVMGKPQGWKITDGVIHSDAAEGGNWLRSEKTYGDFILKLEWRVSKNGNSGVFLRSTREGQPWLTGYEVQISNEPRDDEHCTGSLYGYAAVNPRPDESAEKWHAYELHCHGPRITVISDGVKCVDYDQSTSEKTKDKPVKGFIGLQDSHSPAGNWIEYRNIRIKELK